MKRLGVWRTREDKGSGATTIRMHSKIAAFEQRPGRKLKC
jgi:hypothetical protein